MRLHLLSPLVACVAVLAFTAPCRAQTVLSPGDLSGPQMKPGVVDTAIGSPVVASSALSHLPIVSTVSKPRTVAVVIWGVGLLLGVNRFRRTLRRS